MRKVIIPRKDFILMDLPNGFKIIHKPSEIEAMAYGMESPSPVSWAGGYIEDNAWKQIESKLYEHYNCKVIIR